MESQLNTRIGFLDLEWNIDKQIIQIGLSVLNKDTFNIDYTMSVLVNQPYDGERNWPIRKLTRITKSMLTSKGIQFSQAYEILCKLDFYKMDIYCWGNNDQRVLRQNCNEHQLPEPPPIIDYSERYKKIVGKGKPKGLTKAITSLGLDPFGTAHNARYDALNTARIFKALNQSI